MIFVFIITFQTKNSLQEIPSGRRGNGKGSFWVLRPFNPIFLISFGLFIALLVVSSLLLKSDIFVELVTVVSFRDIPELTSEQIAVLLEETDVPVAGASHDHGRTVFLCQFLHFLQ